MTGVVPLYAGQAIFGPAPYVRGWANPVARQTRGFVGLHGLVTKRCGSRGASAEAAGVLAGTNFANQAAAEAAFEAWKIAGTANPLFDTLSRTWPLMILIAFRPTGPLYQDINGICREYTAEFLGLSHPF